MFEIICINCPNGCALEVREENGELIVSGATCKRGVEYAISEMTCPVRTISSTVRTTFSSCPVVPVKLSSPVPLDKVFPIMEEINRVLLDKRLARGEAVIKNVCQTKSDVVLTSNMLK